MITDDNDGSYPRPQLVRHTWKSLDGTWEFAFDAERLGERQRWYDVDAEQPFNLVIEVPFPPESPASGLHDLGFHPVVWYRRVVTSEDLVEAAHPSDRTLIHFGAVDHHASVWFDGVRVGDHLGGQSPFHVDVTDLVGDATANHVLVVRAEDDPLDAAVPRGKQDWRESPRGIWYHRTTGIWQSVWTETVPAIRILDVAWTPRLSESSVTCEVHLSARPVAPLTLQVSLALGDENLTEVTIRVDGPRVLATLVLPPLLNGQDRARFLWSPEHPVLIDAHVVLRARAGREDSAHPALDVVDSYFGMRSVGVGKHQFVLNGHPYYLRSVLNQGYRQDTHLASVNSDALREEVELIKSMGFNAVRVHQKAEDPRFLYWTDRLGLLVWGETANAYEFSARAVGLLTNEWLDLVRRDRSHPSVVAWVPINESWGIQDVASDPAQQAFSVALANLTRAVDPSRPVMSNEGWEHLDSDILGLHDYSASGEALIARYRDPQAIRATLQSWGPTGRAPVLSEAQVARFEAGDSPLMITEFGGVNHADANSDDAWGYVTAHSEEDFASRLSEVFSALQACPGVVGYCYTQLLDTLNETNGLLTVDRTPKLPLDTIRRIVTGQSHPVDAPTSTMGWRANPAPTQPRLAPTNTVTPEPG